MPNSEKTLRRLRRLGIIVAILGIVTVGQAIYFQARTGDAQQCVERKFDQFAGVLAARSDAAEQEAEARVRESAARSKESASVRRVLLSFNAAVAAGEDITQKERQAYIDALAAYDENVAEVDAELRDVKAELDEVRQERSENPVPDYPKGACEE